LGAAIAIALFTWPYPSIEASAGTDESWAIALHLAVDRGLDFGREILFTYGPLGFLSQPLLVTTATGIASFLFALVLQVGLSVLVLRSAMRTFPAVAAVLLTYLVLAMLAASQFSNLADYIPFVVFLVAVRALEAEPPAAARWLVPALAALTALELLVKLNGGVVCFVLLALVVWRWRPGGWRSEAVFAGTFAVSLVLLWLASGSDLQALPTWLRLSYHVAASYTTGMAVAVADGLQSLAVALLLVAAALAVARLRTLPGLRRYAFAAVCFVYGFGYFKEGFIRPDPVHVSLFFAALAVGVLAVGWSGELRWAAASLVVACAGAAAVAVGSHGFLTGIGAHARDAFHEGRVLVAGRGSTLSSTRAAARRHLALSDETERLVRGHSVDVHPNEASAAWAYGFKWRPQLFIQDYMATDHALDVANARRLEQHGAERILRQLDATPLDGKHPLFIAPETSLVLICRYRLLGVSGNWQTLGRTGDRCGRSRRLGTVTAQTGESVHVPVVPGAIVYARVHSGLTSKQKLRALALKPLPLPDISLDGRRYRIVADTARGALILRLPYADSTFVRQDVSALKLAKVASPYKVEFFALPLKKR
jgi:hypothetical protein